MKPEWCPSDIWQSANTAVIHAPEYTQRLHEDVARALLDAHQRGKEENQAEIDRLNKVIARMQQTMSSQAEQWTRSMAEARREGMEEAALYLDKNSAGGAWVHAIRAKAQEVKT